MTPATKKGKLVRIKFKEVEVKSRPYRFSKKRAVVALRVLPEFLASISVSERERLRALKALL